MTTSDRITGERLLLLTPETMDSLRKKLSGTQTAPAGGAPSAGQQVRRVASQTPTKAQAECEASGRAAGAPAASVTAESPEPSTKGQECMV